MNPDQLALWRRIQAHALDDPAAANPFSLRLAAENRWAPGFTRRAIEEYRRFVFIAVAGGHPVAPSDAVDQVWHLHLLYTRDYWEEFCPKVLGRSLHHGPARGGVREGGTLADWYGRTRASYREFFGAPPADLWPENPVHPRTVRVDVGRNWVMPKPRVFEFWRRRERGLLGRGAAARGNALQAANAVATRAAVGLAIAAAGWPAPARGAAAGEIYPWPFELRGPEFLGFFAGFALVAFVVAMVVRRAMRVPVESVPLGGLDGYEVAQLSGGEKRTVEAALASAASRGLLDIDRGLVKRTERAFPSGLPLVELSVCEAVGPAGTKVNELPRRMRPVLNSLEEGLVERGLVMRAASEMNARLVPFALAALVPLVGWFKVDIGLERQRPVTILVLLTIVTGVAALFFLKRPRLSRRGESALEELRLGNRRLADFRAAEAANGGGSFGAMLPMAVGLWGLSALDGTPLERMKQHIAPPNSGDGGSVGDSSSSSSESGGGDGGGGGGCGGCGGGGGD